MSDPNLLRLVIAALGALWLVWIVFAHHRRRAQGERLETQRKPTQRGSQRREPSFESPAPADAQVPSARGAAAAAAMEMARERGRASSASLDPELALELEKLSQVVSGDLPPAPESRSSAKSRVRVEPTFGDSAPEAAAALGGKSGGDRQTDEDPPSRAGSSAHNPIRSSVGTRSEGPYDRLVTLFVVAMPGEEISGYELVVATEKCGLEFGDRDVYHRLVDGRPEAGPVFSVANMTKPGSFDLATITDLMTPGLTFFMTLPGPMRALDAWDTMLPTAQRMAELLGAQVLDEEHNALGRQRIQHLRDELRAYDRTLERQTIKRNW